MTNGVRTVSGFIGMIASVSVFAQSSDAPATQQPTDPSAASSPHQRAAVKSPSDESAATSSGADPSTASTPHQKQAMKKKHKAKAPSNTPAGDTPQQ